AAAAAPAAEARAEVGLGRERHGGTGGVGGGAGHRAADTAVLASEHAAAGTGPRHGQGDGRDAERGAHAGRARHGDRAGSGARAAAAAPAREDAARRRRRAERHDGARAESPRAHAAAVDSRGRRCDRARPRAGASDRQRERLARLHDALERAVAAEAVMHDVQLAPLVLAERGDPERRVDELGTRPRLPALNPVPDAARAVIAVEVAPEELRKAAAAIAVAPGDRAVVRQVAVLEDGQRQRAVVTAARRVVAVGPLHEAPAVVLPSRARGRLEVHLLPLVLTDVGDKEIPELPVEAEPPRVAETVRPDLGPRARRAPEGVGRRDHVGSGAVHVDAEDLAEELTEILGAVAGIAHTAPITHAD